MVPESVPRRSGNWQAESCMLLAAEQRPSFAEIVDRIGATGKSVLITLWRLILSLDDDW